MVLIIFFPPWGAIIAWRGRGWPSVFQDSVKNMAPRWRMKSPNGFCEFLATLCHRPPTYSRTLFCRRGCWSILGPCSRAIEGNLLSRAHFSELTSLTSSGRLRPPPPQSSYSSSSLSPSSCRRPLPSPPLSSCRCRRRPHVF